MEFFNPNNWPLHPPHEFRIYGDDNAQTWGVVDEEDYHFLIQWKWSWTKPSSHRKSSQKRYLRRVMETQLESPYKGGGTYVNPETGWEVRHRKPRLQQTLRMHVVIMLRTGITPPGPDWELVDHIDGDERNYRRRNLRWATHSLNTLNRFGIHAIQAAAE